MFDRYVACTSNIALYCAGSLPTFQFSVLERKSMQTFCFWTTTTSFRLSAVSFRMTGNSSGVLETRNVHPSKSSETVTCSINHQELVTLSCLKQLVNAKISKSPDFRLQSRNNTCRPLKSDTRWIFDVFSNSMLLSFSSDDFIFRAVPETILNPMRE